MDLFNIDEEDVDLIKTLVDDRKSALESALAVAHGSLPVDPKDRRQRQLERLTALQERLTMEILYRGMGR